VRPMPPIEPAARDRCWRPGSGCPRSNSRGRGRDDGDLQGCDVAPRLAYPVGMSRDPGDGPDETDQAMMASTSSDWRCPRRRRCRISPGRPRSNR
jgi:hypothetical protein